MTKPTQEACFLCNMPCDAVDDFCHGCQATVCEECSESYPVGGHDPNDHLDPGYDDMAWEDDYEGEDW